LFFTIFCFLRDAHNKENRKRRVAKEGAKREREKKRLRLD
jgi:hypothetical protein